MTTIEYYYPLTELTVKTENGNKYFDCSQNKQVNFAMKRSDSKENRKGQSKAYYIKDIPTDDDTKSKMTFYRTDGTDGIYGIIATKYLVIQHKLTHKIYDKFYLAIPICVVGDDKIHLYKKSNNSSLSESLSILDNASSLTKTVKFSLEHVIASMKNFEPTGYYNIPKMDNDSGIPYNIFVLNAPLYTTNFISTNFYGGPEDISIKDKKLTQTIKDKPSTNITFKRIYKKSQCNKKTEKVEPKTLFSFSSLKEKTRIDYLNIIYSIGYLMLVMLF